MVKEARKRVVKRGVPRGDISVSNVGSLLLSSVNVAVPTL